MDRKWISRTTSGVFSYLYNQMTGEDERVKGNNSRSALSKGIWVKDLPKNNYEPLEASHGARAMAKKYNREKDLEEKIASLREQSNAKSREIVSLQHKVFELQQNGEIKVSDLAKKLEDKEQLMKKAKNFISATKGKLLKKEAEVEELSSELQLLKERENEFSLTKVSLEDRVNDLQERLDEKLNQLQEKDQEWEQKKEKQSVEIITLKRKLSSSNDDLQNTVSENNKMKDMLTSSREREEELNKRNASLGNHNKELQEKLKTMNNQLVEREKVYSEEKGNLLHEIAALKDKLCSTNAELKSSVSSSKEMAEMLNSYKEREEKLKMVNTSLEVGVKELQERLGEMNNSLQEKQRVCNEEKENLSLKIVALENKLSVTKDELQKAVSKNSEMTTMMRSCKGREQNFERINASLQLDVTKLQEKLNEVSGQLQKNEEIKEKTEEKLQQEIVTLKNELSSTNTKLEEILQGKNETVVLLDNSRAFSIPKKNLISPDEQLLVSCTKPDQGKQSKNSGTVNTLSFIAEWCDISPPPPIIINNVPRHQVQTQPPDGLRGKLRVNPFSLKATRAAKGESSIKLRPASPFIPVTNIISCQMNRHAYIGAGQGLKNTEVNPFSSIESQGFFSKFLKWCGF